jgi:hypothetical protein
VRARRQCQTWQQIARDRAVTRFAWRVGNALEISLIQARHGARDIFLSLFG